MSNLDEPYDDDDNYDEYQDYDKHKKDYAKHWFKFDPSIWKWLYDSMEDEVTEVSPNVWITNIPGFKTFSFPVNGWASNIGKGHSFQYLGSNHIGEPIWKNKYFICDPIQIEYVNHIKQHAVHFVKQPHYYKGLFDIQN